MEKQLQATYDQDIINKDIQKDYYEKQGPDQMSDFFLKRKGLNSKQIRALNISKKSHAQPQIFANERLNGSKFNSVSNNEDKQQLNQDLIYNQNQKDVQSIFYPQNDQKGNDQLQKVQKFQAQNEDISKQNRYNQIRKGSIFLENQQKQMKLEKGMASPSMQYQLVNNFNKIHQKGLASSVELGQNQLNDIEQNSNLSTAPNLKSINAPYSYKLQKFGSQGIIPQSFPQDQFSKNFSDKQSVKSFSNNLNSLKNQQQKQIMISQKNRMTEFDIMKICTEDDFIVSRLISAGVLNGFQSSQKKQANENQKWSSNINDLNILKKKQLLGLFYKSWRGISQCIFQNCVKNEKGVEIEYLGKFIPQKISQNQIFNNNQSQTIEQASNHNSKEKYLESEINIQFVPALDLIEGGKFKLIENQQNLSPFSKRITNLHCQKVSLQSIAKQFCNFQQPEILQQLMHELIHKFYNLNKMNSCECSLFIKGLGHLHAYPNGDFAFESDLQFRNAKKLRDYYLQQKIKGKFSDFYKSNNKTRNDEIFESNSTQKHLIRNGSEDINIKNSQTMRALENFAAQRNSIFESDIKYQELDRYQARKNNLQTGDYKDRQNIPNDVLSVNFFINQFKSPKSIIYSNIEKNKNENGSNSAINVNKQRASKSGACNRTALSKTALSQYNQFKENELFDRKQQKRPAPSISNAQMTNLHQQIPSNNKSPKNRMNETLSIISQAKGQQQVINSNIAQLSKMSQKSFQTIQNQTQKRIKNEKMQQNKKILQDLLNNKYISGEVLPNLELQKETKYMKTDVSLNNEKQEEMLSPQNGNRSNLETKAFNQLGFKLSDQVQKRTKTSLKINSIVSVDNPQDVYYPEKYQNKINYDLNNQSLKNFAKKYEFQMKKENPQNISTNQNDLDFSLNYPGYRGQLKQNLKSQPQTELNNIAKEEETVVKIPQTLQQQKITSLTQAWRQSSQQPSLTQFSRDSQSVLLNYKKQNIDDIQMKPQGEEKQIQLRQQFMNISPFYLRKHVNVIVRKPNEELQRSAIDGARERFELSLKNENQAEQNMLNSFYEQVEETSKIQELQEEGKHQKKLQLQDDLKIQIKNDKERKQVQKELYMSSMGLENIYGPVETEEAVKSMIDRRNQEKRLLTQQLGSQIQISKNQKMNQKLMSQELEQINVVKADIEIQNQKTAFENHLKIIRGKIQEGWIQSSNEKRLKMESKKLEYRAIKTKK